MLSQVFEKYVKERAEEERIEKKKKMKEAKDNFRVLLEEASLNGKWVDISVDYFLIWSLSLTFVLRSAFSDFASKYGKEARFKGIEKMRDREQLFNDFVGELRKKEKEEKNANREKVRTTIFFFIPFLTFLEV